MSKLKLNKSSLSLEQTNLKNYKKYLPSLELKRKKLLSVRSTLDEQMTLLKENENDLKNRAQQSFPMINEYINIIEQFIKVEKYEILEENIVGVKLPCFKSIQFKVFDYVYLNSPHWFEALIDLICKLVEINLRIKTAESRTQLLDRSIRTVTQRKNLFEKILIPTALEHIRLIQIFLSDNERAAVVSSKIAKKKRLQL